MKIRKKFLSGICLLTAALLAVGCGTQPLPETDLIPEKVSETNASAVPERIPEVFSVLTVSKDSGINADGYSAGQSFCGFTLHDDGSITVDVDGKEMAFEEAADLTGCTLTENADGSMSVRAPFRKGQVIVKAEGDFDTYGAEAVKETIKNHYLLTYSSETEAYSAYRLLSEDERVEYAEPNAVLKSSGFAETNRIETWGLDKTGAVDFCRELSEKNENLPEIDVAVIDTGIYYNHSVFEGRILENGRNFCEGYPEKEKNKAADDYGHGSHCAGIICSATNDNVKILPVKVLDDVGRGDTYEIYCGMMYAIECGADVISMSLGGYGKSNLFAEAALMAHEKGIPLCVAAGNESAGCDDDYASLSGLEECVVVSSVDVRLNPSYFSNYQNIDFAAPGEDILSVSIEGPDKTEEMSGTSMATPYVAACFANVLSADNTLSGDEVYDILKANAVDLCEPGYDESTGWGLVNLKDFHMSTEREDEPSKQPSEEPDEIFESEKYIIKDGVLVFCDTSEEEVLDLAALVEQKVIPEFTEIGNSLFHGSSLREVILPDSVDVISEDAFFECDKLQKVVTNASIIGKYAFCACSNLREFCDSNILKVEQGAFVDCRRLEKADFTKITEVSDFAFDRCGKLGSDSFCFENLKSVGYCSFSATDIKGKIDLSSVEKIGIFSFDMTKIEEIILSENITTLPKGFLNNCSSLKKISAPSVTRINKYALALGKKEYSAETAVETDIDFSKVTKISPDGAFEGFVFSGPVSFDMLEDVEMSAFDGAFGESASFPLISTAASSEDCTVNFNALYFEGAETIDFSNINYNGVIGTGDNIKELNLDFHGEARDIWLCSLSDDETELSEKSELKYHSKSELYTSEIPESVPALSTFSMNAVLPDTHLTYTWSFTDESGNVVRSEEDSDYSVYFAPVSAGSYTFSAEVKDSSGNAVYSESRNIQVTEPEEVTALKLREPVVLKGNLSDSEYNALFSFTPETDGTYIFYNLADELDIVTPDGRIDYVYIEDAKLDLKGGETYYLRGNYSENLYISVNSSDCVRDSIPYELEYGWIGWFTEADGSRSVRVVTGSGKELTEGKDFYTEYMDSYCEGDTRAFVCGIGEYYGLYSNNAVFPLLAVTDEPVNISAPETDFVPEKSGIYNIVFSPVRSEIENAVFKNTCITSFEYEPEITIVNRVVKPLEYPEYHTDKNISKTASYEISLYLEEGTRYRLTDWSAGKTELLITQKPTLGQCEADYSFSYQYNGEAVVPDIKLTFEGKVLEEGKDYTLTVWKNNSPGIMFAMAEGMGDYAGKRNFAMVIEGEGCGFRVGKFGDTDVIDVNTDTEFEYLSVLPYRITIQNDTAVRIKTKYASRKFFMDFTSTESGVQTKYSTDKNEQIIRIEKGRYLVKICNDKTSSGLYYRENTVISSDDTIRPVKNADIVLNYDNGVYPEISVYYDGQKLAEDTDYIFAENENNDSSNDSDEQEETSEKRRTNSVIIEGINGYYGRKEMEIAVLPETEENGVLISGEKRIIELNSPVRYEWIPENEKYIFESSSYINADIIVVDENNNYHWHGKVSSRNTPEIIFEPGKKYSVYVTGVFNEAIEFTVRTDGRLSDCETEYDALIPFTDSKDDVPEIIFRDGDYVLEEGKDYRLLVNGFVNDEGRREYVYRGCGKYFGDVTIPVVTYRETITDFENYKDALTDKVYNFEIGKHIGMIYHIGDKIKLKFTSSDEGQKIISTLLTVPGKECTEYLNLFLYDANGNFICANKDAMKFELRKGETVYFQLLPPYVVEFPVQNSAYKVFLSFSVEYTDDSDAVSDMAGDVNCDGKINIFDLMRLSSYILGTGELSEQGMKNAVFDSTGTRKVPNAADIMMLKKLLLGADSKR